jgi:hypothetical protein
MENPHLIDRHQGPADFYSNLLTFQSDKLSTKTKMTLYRALIRSKMTYACPAWESAAGTQLLKLQRLQNKVLRVIGGVPRRTPIRNMHAELQIPYVYMTS